MTESVGGSAQTLFRIYLMHSSPCLSGDRGWSSVPRNHSLESTKGWLHFLFKGMEIRAYLDYSSGWQSTIVRKSW